MQKIGFKQKNEAEMDFDLIINLEYKTTFIEFPFCKLLLSRLNPK